MWVLVAKMKKCGINADDMSSEEVARASKISQIGVRNGFLPSIAHSFIASKEDENCQNGDGISSFEELRANYQKERRKCKELESVVSRMQGEDIGGLDVATLEELQNFHVEAITKICHAKSLKLIEVKCFVQSWYS
ncbi:hypothetical protein JRO89_XS07G0183400 [Xanthoceras sorbifolium]|uniref:Uncharacterized protein n=1 Tax=Xanthoceras sorbifolium TaxID=99658 RepID=A0ABQ8HUA2_9ROSI|nr:hypothetical protein JRO89_XS07G0183400 [Xanthoceras sorbifolium]